MLHLSTACTYYLYCGITDMRKGFDGLCGIIQSQMSLSALSGSVFVFLNRRRTQVKLLVWEGDGFAIYQKRLERPHCPATTVHFAGHIAEKSRLPAAFAKKRLSYPHSFFYFLFSGSSYAQFIHGCSKITVPRYF